MNQKIFIADFYAGWRVSACRRSVPVGRPGLPVTDLDIHACRQALPDSARSRYWLRRVVVLTALPATIWRVIGTVLFPYGQPEYQALVSVYLVGTAAIGLFTLNSVSAAWLAMAVPALLQPAI